MSVIQPVHPPGAGLQASHDGIPHPFARTGAFVRAQARRLRKSLAARERYDQLPVGPRQVMDAAVRLAALQAEDGAHWRPRQLGPEGAELVRAIRPGVVGVVTDAQVMEWLGYLEREELVSLAGGGLRLSILDADAFWKPRPAQPRGKAARPAARPPSGKRDKADQARINALYAIGPQRTGESDAEYETRKTARREQVDRLLRDQGHLLLVLPGGVRLADGRSVKETFAAARDAAAPGRPTTQEVTQEVTQTGEVGLPVGCLGLPVDSASRAPGVSTPLAAAAAKDLESISSKAAAAAFVLTSAGAGARTQATQTATQTATQADPSQPSAGAEAQDGPAPDEAEAMAGALFRRYPFVRQGRGGELSELCRFWLADGRMTRARIEDVIAEAWAKNERNRAVGQARPIGSFRYFTKALGDEAKREADKLAAEGAARSAAAPDRDAAAAPKARKGPFATSYDETKFNAVLEQADRGDWPGLENSISVLRKTAGHLIEPLCNARPKIREWLDGGRMQA